MDSNTNVAEHPNFAEINSVITDMSIMQIQAGFTTTDQEIAGGLTKILLDHGAGIPFEAVASVLSIVAALSVRHMPPELRAQIEGTASDRTH